MYVLSDLLIKTAPATAVTCGVTCCDVTDSPYVASVRTMCLTWKGRRIVILNPVVLFPSYLTGRHIETTTTAHATALIIPVK